MLKHLGLLCMFLLFIAQVSLVSAETLAEKAAPGAVSLTEANKYLTAESKKEIQAGFNDVQKQLIENNDANFRELDGRMAELMEEVRTKVIVGGIGAVFVAMAIGMLILSRTMKNNSYESFLEKQLQALGSDVVQTQGEVDPRQMEALGQLQQREYTQQPAYSGISSEFGSVMAGEMSQVNQWQTQPVYEGAWVSPQEVEQYREQYTPAQGHQYTGEIESQAPQYYNDNQGY